MTPPAETDALRIVRLVERDMAEQALKAWRSAEARRGLADHSALIVHADALSRWSERLRMALKGHDYRADARDIPPATCPTCDGRGVWMDEPCECVTPPTPSATEAEGDTP